MKSLLLFCFVLTGLGCATAFAAPPDADARKEALHWLALMDTGRFGPAHDSMAPRIASNNRAEFLSWARSRRAPLGQARTRQFFQVTHTSTLIGSPDGNYEKIAFKTSFARKAQAVELIILTSETGHWQVSGYRLY